MAGNARAAALIVLDRENSSAARGGGFPLVDVLSTARARYCLLGISSYHGCRRPAVEYIFCIYRINYSERHVASATEFSIPKDSTNQTKCVLVTPPIITSSYTRIGQVRNTQNRCNATHNIFNVELSAPLFARCCPRLARRPTRPTRPSPLR